MILRLTILVIIFSFQFVYPQSEKRNIIIESEIDKINLLIQKSDQKGINNSTKISFLDSAYLSIIKLPNDKFKSNYLGKLSYAYFTIGKYDKFKITSLKNIHLSESISDTSNLARGNINLAYYYHVINWKADSSFTYYSKALINYKTLGSHHKVGTTLLGMAFVQEATNDYSGCEINALKAIEIFKEFKDYLNLYKAYNLLGLIYTKMKDYKLSLENFNFAMNATNKIENKDNYRNTLYNNIGQVYEYQKNYKKAIEFYKKGLKNKKLKQEDLINYIFLIDNMAYSMFKDSSNNDVSSMFFESLHLRDSLQILDGMHMSYIHLSEYFYYQNNPSQSIDYAKKARDIAEKGYFYEGVLNAHHWLAKIDTTNNAKHYEAYIKLNDSLQIVDRKVREKFTRIQYNTESVEARNQELTQERWVIITIGGGLLLIAVLLYYIRVQNSKNKELQFVQEQQKANEEIYTLLNQQQQQLELGQLQERERISQDLHDGVLGKLFGTRLGLGFFEINGDEDDHEKYEKLVGGLQDVEKEIREISHALKNETLTGGSEFAKIIEAYLEMQTSVGSFRYKLEIANEIKWEKISYKTKANLYRLIQEAIQNIVKHSKADKVAINIDESAQDLKVVVNDNGIGFNTNRERSGIGLKNMRSRVSQLNGNLEINSKKGQGTQLVFRIQKG